MLSVSTKSTATRRSLRDGVFWPGPGTEKLKLVCPREFYGTRTQPNSCVYVGILSGCKMPADFVLHIRLDSSEGRGRQIHGRIEFARGDPDAVGGYVGGIQRKAKGSV